MKEEDPTRPTTSAMNWAKLDMPFPKVMDVISFNYQYEGIRQDPIFGNVKDRIKTKPQYEPYHKKFPNKVILSSETASAASRRGLYLFQVTDFIFFILFYFRYGLATKVGQLIARFKQLHFGYTFQFQIH